MWKAPARNPNFTGRDAELDRLREGLTRQPHGDRARAARNGRDRQGLVVHRLVQDVTRYRHPGKPEPATSGDFGTALALLRADLPDEIWALRIRKAVLGPDHLDVATALNYVGWALSALGRRSEALPLYQRALRIHEAAFGPDHPATRQSREYVEG